MKVSIPKLFALMFIAFAIFVIVSVIVYQRSGSYMVAAIFGAVAIAISIALGVGWVRQAKR